MIEPPGEPPKKPKTEREVRLAEALRANLKRRKSQTRGRTGAPDKNAPAEPDDSPGR